MGRTDANITSLPAGPSLGTQNVTLNQGLGTDSSADPIVISADDNNACARLRARFGGRQAEAGRPANNDDAFSLKLQAGHTNAPQSWIPGNQTECNQLAA